MKNVLILVTCMLLCAGILGASTTPIPANPMAPWVIAAKGAWSIALVPGDGDQLRLQAGADAAVRAGQALHHRPVETAGGRRRADAAVRSGQALQHRAVEAAGGRWRANAAVRSRPALPHRAGKAADGAIGEPPQGKSTPEAADQA